MSNNVSSGVADLGATAVEVALGYVGQEEVPRGSNAGPFVEGCLKLLGLGKGYAWCQGFVFRCFAEAADSLHMANPVVHTASVLDCWNKTAVQYKITPEEFLKHPELIRPGYQMILKEGPTTGHTGIIERVEFDAAHPELAVIHTIEGNTNADGSREGYGVFRKVRHLGKVHGVIRH